MAVSELAQYFFQVEQQIDPLDSYQLLSQFRPLLLEGNGLHPEARHSYLAISPKLTFTIAGGTARIEYDDGKTEERNGNPLQLLTEICQQYRFESPHPGFTGGFVGAIGYGFTQAIEPTLPRPNYDEQHPELCLRLCRDLIAWDHETGTCKIWTTDLPGESKAQARLEKIKQQLNQAIPAALALQHDESVEWTTSLKKQDFKLAVTELKEKIRIGDLFQANIATKFSATVNANPVELYRRLRSHNPSPYLALMEFEGTAIVSGSPEQLFAVESGQIRARPIAGTRPRGNDENEDAGYELELMEDRKEQAEHTMLVDLVRNDLAKICTPGTVLVPERGSVERYRRVMHLVSRVEGKLRPGTGFIDWLQALFPGGTITGAPKHRACLRISEAEPVARGFYTGSAGFLSWGH